VHTTTRLTAFVLVRAVLAVSVVTTGCTASKLGGNDAVHLSGRVLDAAGQPAANARVALFKEADAGELLVGVTFAIGTLGAACFAPQAPPVCAHTRKGTTGPDGTFSFELTSRDTQGSVGNADAFDLTAVIGDGDAARVSSVRFKIQHTKLEVPDLRVWDATASARIVSNAVAVTWPPLPPDYGGDAHYTIKFVDSSAQKPTVWSATSPASGRRTDQRLLEDRHGTIEVDATTSRSGPDTTFRYTYISRTVGFDGPGAPPSRRAACTVYDSTGAATPLNPCPLTDGDLFTRAGLGAAKGGGAHPAVVLDTNVAAAKRVVVRGAVGVVNVEVSNDGTNWSFIGSDSGSLIDVAPTRPLPGRFVRVKTPGGVDLGGLTEVSVWG
jgi:hypothetical protein